MAKGKKNIEVEITADVDDLVEKIAQSELALFKVLVLRLSERVSVLEAQMKELA